MHESQGAARFSEMRAAINLLAQKQKARRDTSGAPTLVDVDIPRAEPRTLDQRNEDRRDGVVDRATIRFRRERIDVQVVNVSTSGVQIESGIVPRIGEPIGIEFEGFDRLDGVVRWVRQGRIGLDVGEDGIELD